ncbi:MAG TPA: hypothetical protein VGE02_08210 [Gemmatimonadales bacterium]
MLATLVAVTTLGATGCGAPGAEADGAYSAGVARTAPRAPLSDTSFAGTVARLSEPGGYFDSDNLVSNETAYLHALGPLRALGTRGGAYLGVGPEQNFSYIAALRPEIAYVIDVRRDNLLQHLLYKSLFALARNRAEYLLLLTGRAVPEEVERHDGRPLEELVALTDSLPFDAAAHALARERVAAAARATGVQLSDADLATMARIHDAFAHQGLDLRFTSHDRPPRAYYPTLRQLLLASDREGRMSSYLADEERFRFLQRLQREDRVIPVVGDLAGPHALAAIGEDMARRGLTVSAFYTSNVEFYLMRAGTFDDFARTTAALPRDRRSAIVRSCFGYACGNDHPSRSPGHYSVQLVQRMDDFAAEHERGGYVTYRDVVTRSILPPR